MATETIAATLASSGLQLKTDRVFSPLCAGRKELAKTSISERYTEFLFKTKPLGFSEIEQLVPYVELPFAPSRTELHAARHGDDAAARRLLETYPARQWGYYLPLSPAYSTLGPKDAIAGDLRTSKRRSEHRLNFIWSGIQGLLGRDRTIASVLDIACNWGGFAIEAMLRGARQVDAFDIRAENIAKATALQRHFAFDAINFATADIFRFEPQRTYDVVLNLGLMYHISQPFEMMKRTYDLTGTLAIIDTVVHREPFSGFILGSGQNATAHAATAVGVELHPTYRALIDLAYLVGFRQVIELKGVPDPEWSNFAQDPYGNGTRRCIAAFR